MKKKLIVAPCLFALLILSACKNDSNVINNTNITPDSTNNITSSLPTPTQTLIQDNTSDQIVTSDQDNNSTSPTPAAMPNDTEEYDVIRDGYSKGKDIAIDYPQIKGLKDTNKQSDINELLKKGAMSYLSVSSDLATLDISYEIEWKGNNVLSVQYYGWEEYSDAPHPNNLFFTININSKTGKEIELKDMFHLDQNIVDSILKNGKVVGPLDPNDPDLTEEVRDNLNNNLTVSSLKDAIFYFTRDSFIISIEVSHAIGDYAMIETKYSDLKRSINPKKEVWKDFEEALNKDSGNIADGNQNQSSDELTLNDLYKFTEIDDQSFDVDLENWGSVRFVSSKDDQGKLLFFLTDDQKSILYQFPDYYNSYGRNQTISAVAFRDVNEDSLKDIIIITASDPNVTSCDIYFQTDYDFVQIPDLYHDLNQSDTTYDTVGKVADYMKKTGNAIVAEFLDD
jgi:hypothetical protein